MIKTSKQYSKKANNNNHTQQQQQLTRQNNNNNVSVMNQANNNNNNNINNNNNNNYNNNTTSTKFTQAQFMKYYQQNIRIRKQLQQKNSYINELRSKLQAQLSLNKTVNNNPYAQLNKLKTQVRKQRTYNNLRPSSAMKGNNNNSNKTFYNTTNLSGDSRKLQNLLEIIQSYKQKLLISQQQCANLRQQKLLLQQDVKMNSNNNISRITNRNNNNNSSLYRQRQHQHIQNQKTMQSKHDQLLNKLRQKSSQLQLQKQRNKYVQAQLRRLQTKQRTLQMDSDTLQQLKVQNRILQQRIMKLTMINGNNSTQGQLDYRSLEEKNKQLQHKLKSGLEKYNRIKQEKTKIQIDYKLLQNKLIQLQHQSQQMSKQNLELKKNQVNDPIIQRLIKDKLLLAQVIGEIEEGERYNNNSNRQKQQSTRNKQHTMFQSTHKLLLQKQALAKQLIQVKNRIQLLQQTWREKQTMIKIEKEEMMAQLQSSVTEQQQNNNNNNNKYINTTKSYTSKQGIQYDGDITMFSDQRTPLTSNVNYFDIYLGRVNLIQTLVKSVTPLNTSSPLLMATVDFYNFPTENTKLSQGLVADLDTQFVFKISQQEFFYKFLLKGNVKISIWATEGNKNYLVGHVDVVLKQLVMKNRPNVSPVINTSAPIINGQKVVGTIFFDMRMRLPIYQQSSKLLSQPMSSLNEQLSKQSQQQQRKLIIQIDEGSGFKQSSKLFVYYQFRLQDYYTRTSPGPVPKWAHYKMIDLRYDQEMKNYLKKNELQMTVFDDSVVMDQKDNDIVGMGVVSLVGLVENKVVREKIIVRKNGVVTGSIEVKVFWYQSSMSSKQKQQQLNNTQNNKSKLLQSLHNDILQHIHLTNSTAERQFKKIDSNSTGMISFDEFNMWVIRIKQSQRYSRELISMYYDGFQQPLNLLNWIGKLSQKHQQIIKHNSQTQLMPQLSKINQLLKKNSVQIDTKVSLREYLKDKNMFNVTLDIDANGNGQISREQLIAYMNRHNVVVDQGEIQGDSVNLVSFLKKYGK